MYVVEGNIWPLDAHGCKIASTKSVQTMEQMQICISQFECGRMPAKHCIFYNTEWRDQLYVHRYDKWSSIASELASKCRCFFVLVYYRVDLAFYGFFVVSVIATTYLPCHTNYLLTYYDVHYLYLLIVIS